MNKHLSACLTFACLSFVSPVRAEEAPKPAVPATPAVPAPAVPEVKPAAPATPPAIPAKERLEPLQGVWEGVEVGHEAEGKCVVTIKGDTMHFERAHGKAWHKAVLEFPADVGPQQMKVTIKEGSNALYPGKSAALLYRLEPDGTLIFAGGPPGDAYVPKGFQEDVHTRRFVLKKVQPKQPEPPTT